LTYEYDKIGNPEKSFMPTLMSAVIFVVLLYATVALGATMIGGATSMISFKEIALSIAAETAFGKTGLIVMTVAAGFATAAAINSTLFSTANLAKRIASQDELPSWFNHTNKNDVPDRSIIFIGILAGVLAIVGSLSSLVEAASLAFLFTFGIVNWIAYRESDKRKWIPLMGIIIGSLVGLALIFRLVISKPLALGGILGLVLLIILGRPYLLRKKEKSSKSEQNEN
ncbi:MAG: amino acid permease, partial [Christiangramia sp.]|nr:amino acid permease [Christiangramia sp.]